MIPPRPALGPDVVVTVPMRLWEEWLAEGDLPGEKWSGTFWSFYLRGTIPNLPPLHLGESPMRVDEAMGPLAGFGGQPRSNLWQHIADGVRCYVVAHRRLRGYAPLAAIELTPARRQLVAFIRRGGARAVTIEDPILGFRGWRYRWWSRNNEQPFPGWKTP